MKIRYEKPKGQRLTKSTCHRPISLEPVESGWWFDLYLGEWRKDSPNYSGKMSNYYSMENVGYKNIWSLKAAKRTICNWDIPKGTVFIVMLPWVGHNFYITK